MEGRDFVVLRQPVLADRAAALEVLVVAAGLEQQHRVAGLGEARGNDTAPRARPDDDVFVFCRLRVHDTTPQAPG